jgi:hypothetical protein
MLRTAVRRFLARGRLARFAACLVVAFAAVVWIAVASAVLRVLFVALLFLVVIWCGWLIVGVWVGEQGDPDQLGGATWRAALRWFRRAVTRAVTQPASAEDEHPRTGEVSRGLTRDEEELGRRERELTEREAAFAVVRSSVDAVVADLLHRQERLHADAEQLHRKLGGQIEAMHAVVARLAELEQGVSLPARGKQPIRERDPRPADHADLCDLPAPIETETQAIDTQPVPFELEPAAAAPRTEFDLQAARAELEADLRLEEIEQREETLRELEEQLSRREHQLADFVAQAQGQLN